VAVVLSRRPGAAGGVEAGQAGGHFVLEVVDDGPGIPPEEMARLPERRFRGAEARTRHPEGSGLGLHIARDVARRHGFDLAFTTPEHGGLAVTFRGPLRNEGPSQDPA
jgi:signal transduction histidine kinase